MAEFNGKSIFNCTSDVGNFARREYVNCINNFIEKKFEESFVSRDAFMKDIVTNQEAYRVKFLEMIEQPVNPYPTDIPDVKMEFVGKDDFGDIYNVQIETMPDFWFYGMLNVPFGAPNAPLVIAQHGGGGSPEWCSEFIGKSNYNFFVQRALERNFVVFTPQTMLWKVNDPETNIDVCYDRCEADKKLKQLGLSMTGLEVFNIRRSLDYLTTLNYIDKKRIGMMGLSYGGYFSLYTAAADTRIKSIYAAGFFNDRTKTTFLDWAYKNSALTFCDAEIAALCAPRRLQIDVGKTDEVFDYTHSVNEGKRAQNYYEKFNAKDNFRFNLWEGGHRFDENLKGFEFFFDDI